MSTSELQDVALPPQDPALEQLVRIINNSDGQCGVTLHASGCLISGVLVSASFHFQRLSELLRDEGIESLSQWSDMWAEDLLVTEEECAEDGPSPSPAHIHLIDARTFAPGSVSSVNQPVWRGRLSAITGWSIGMPDLG